MINKSNKKSLIEGVNIDNINIESDIIRAGNQHQRNSQSQGHGHKHSSNNNLNNKYYHNS
jgi:hypothetical protein